MTNHRSTTVRVWLAGFAALFTCGAALAETIAAGPYYATPAWDQTLPSATRFIVLSNFNNEAVLDRETGLVWERTPAAYQQYWHNAAGQCMIKRLGNRMGWRLPSIQELGSLIDPSSPGGAEPQLPAGHPFTVVGNPRLLPYAYWSSTTDANTPANAWAMRMGNGGATSVNKVSSDFFTVGYFGWCVRGGTANEAQ
jgi:hypothetical protein